VTTALSTAVSRQSLLVVLPAGAGAPSPGTVIAGLPLLRRIVLAAGRAGFDRIGSSPVKA